MRGVPIACALLAVVVSVDITPVAREYLLRQGWKDVWVTDVYDTCPKGFDLPLVKGGLPDKPADWDVVRAGEIIVYVPKDKKYKEDIPRVIYFRRNDKERVAVVNEL